MRTQAMRTTHGICGWGVILVGLLAMFGPSVANAEMPRAVYYDTAQVAQAVTAPVADRAVESARPVPTADAPADVPPEPCLESDQTQRSVGVAALLSDLIRP
jgi:hypothetical protein